MVALGGRAPVVSAGCGDSYNRDDSAQFKKPDICSLSEDLPDAIQVLINWGCRPVWIDEHSFAFLSNIVGDVYVMDLEVNNVTLVTGHFSHAGFSRVYALRNKDLLLVGSTQGQLPTLLNPYQVYEEGRFNGNMFILKAPYYDQDPYPLNAHAWEGVAVSGQSDRIAWSDTNVPFFGSHIFFTLLLYLFGGSNLWTGVIVYDDLGVPALVEQTIIHRKGWLSFMLNEPQDFRGLQDEELLFSTYGPGAEGRSDMWIYDLTAKRAYREVTADLAYNEWEGIGPAFDVALFERDPTATLFSGPSYIDMYVWDFASKNAQVFTQFRRSNGFGLSNAVFSVDGKWVLMGVTLEHSSPGFTTGIALVDFEESYRNLPKVLS